MYFFTCAGLTPILMNILNMLARRDKSKSDWFRIIFNFVVGIVFIVLAAIENTQAAANLAESPWVLPTIALHLLPVLVFSHLHCSLEK